MKQQVNGTVWRSHGSWHWRVVLPGETRRRDIVLTFPFSGKRIPADVDQSVAESAAFRLWDARVKSMRADGTPIFTVNELCDRWCQHSLRYFAEGRRANGAGVYVRELRTLFGNRPVEALTHPDMLAVRKALVARGLARTTVNSYMTAMRCMFAWALDEALISAQTKAELTQVANLKAHRSEARETEPVRAVPDDVVEATCARLPPSLADMVRIHRLTGMRPGEVVQLEWSRIERVGEVWAFRPNHKNEWRNKPRVVAIGPRAQEILMRYQGASGPIFSPARALAERYEEARRARATPMREDEDAKRAAARRAAGACPRKVADRWDVCAYSRAITRTCEQFGIERWSPLQLRHTCATAIRRRHGLAAARAILGHSTGMRITDRYSFEAAEDEILRDATPAALAMG